MTVLMTVETGLMNQSTAVSDILAVFTFGLCLDILHIALTLSIKGLTLSQNSVWKSVTLDYSVVKYLCKSISYHLQDSNNT